MSVYPKAATWRDHLEAFSWTVSVAPSFQTKVPGKWRNWPNIQVNISGWLPSTPHEVDQPAKKINCSLVSRVRLFVTPWTVAFVHGILQARILELVAIPFSRGSSPPRVQTWVSCTVGRFFTIWTTGGSPLIEGSTSSGILTLITRAKDTPGIAYRLH